MKAAAYGMGSESKVSDPSPADFQVRRPDTLQFGSIEGVQRMAGVSRYRLRRLIAKEVVDNALDQCDRVGRPGEVSILREDGDRYIVSDQGRGIPGNAEVLADLFSSGRAMLSAKFLRLPERGALGNGLRVVVAAVALCGGTIIVEAHGRRTVLRPRRVGPTEVVQVTAAGREVGTLLEYSLSAEIIPPDIGDLADAKAAIALARAARPAFQRRPSPHWLDADSFAETFATIEPVETTVRQVLERLDGCTGATAGKLAAPYGKNRRCRDLRESEVAALLDAAQAAARRVKPRNLGPIGENAFGEKFDACIVAEDALRVGRHEPYGRIPVLIEAWASVTTRKGGNAHLRIFVNRTPAVGDVEAVRSSSGGIRLSGFGLSPWAETVEVAGGDCELIIAVTAPLTRQTKSLDLKSLKDKGRAAPQLHVQANYQYWVAHWSRPLLGSPGLPIGSRCRAVIGELTPAISHPQRHGVRKASDRRTRSFSCANGGFHVGDFLGDRGNAAGAWYLGTAASSAAGEDILAGVRYCGLGLNDSRLIIAGVGKIGLLRHRASSVMPDLPRAEMMAGCRGRLHELLPALCKRAVQQER